MGLIPFIPVHVLFSTSFCFVLQTLFFSKHRRSLPPGPNGLPIIGNLLDMPSEKEWLTFAQWGKQWGDICSVTILGQTLVILNSAKLAIELLEKKSSIYSDRPVLQMGGELVGWKSSFVLLPYGDRFRRFRRLFHRFIGSRISMKKFHSNQEMETRLFLQHLLAKPEDLVSHVRKTTGAIILRIAYGYEVQRENDPLVELADRATEQFSVSTAPGGFMVDFLPILRYVPEWVPGAGFKRKARQWGSTLAELVERPLNFVKQQMAAGTASPSFSSSFLESKNITPEEEFTLKWSAASFYSGGADTTVSATCSFFLAMTLYPEAAKKAQAEIDAIIGSDRLPTFSDRDQLPYVEALVKEVLRWHSVVPTGVAHKVTEDDTHDGYFIPKGSLVIANIWQLTHDPEVYENPGVFNPDRFMSIDGKEPEPDPRSVCFGFGRRTCPGLHLADASVWISCAMSLAVFDISKCVENGLVIEPTYDCTTGTISRPKPFKCTIRPRSQKAIALILAEDQM